MKPIMVQRVSRGNVAIARVGTWLAMTFQVVVFLSVGNARLDAQSTAESIVLKNPILKPMQTVSVAAGVAGIIESMLVTEGDLVSIDQPLVRIRCDESKLNYERAKLALVSTTTKATRDVDIRLAEKSAQVAEQELGRTLKANALAADTYPANEVDRYQLVFERSKIEIERCKLDQQLAILAQKQSEIELQQCKQAIDRHTIKSTAQAMVVSVAKHAGEWAEPSSNLLELMSIDRLRVEGFVDANDGLELRKGLPANISILVGKSQHTTLGKIVFISPTANPANGQIRVFIEVENPDAKFRPGAIVTGAIMK